MYRLKISGGRGEIDIRDLLQMPNRKLLQWNFGGQSFDQDWLSRNQFINTIDRKHTPHGVSIEENTLTETYRTPKLWGSRELHENFHHISLQDEQKCFPPFYLSEQELSLHFSALSYQWVKDRTGSIDDDRNGDSLKFTVQPQNFLFGWVGRRGVHQRFEFTLTRQDTFSSSDPLLTLSEEPSTFVSSESGSIYWPHNFNHWKVPSITWQSDRLFDEMANSLQQKGLRKVSLVLRLKISSATPLFHAPTHFHSMPGPPVVKCIEESYEGAITGNTVETNDSRLASIISLKMQTTSVGIIGN